MQWYMIEEWEPDESTLHMFEFDFLKPLPKTISTRCFNYQTGLRVPKVVPTSSKKNL